MTTISVSAPGKIHLLGEHSVVYGKPAIITAINKRCRVDLTPGKKNYVTLSSLGHGKPITITSNEILNLTKKVQKTWQEYKRTQSLPLLQSLTATPLSYALIVIGETMQYFGQTLPGGITIEITSEIPSGAGMGSSAALAVGIAGALSIFFTSTLDKKHVNNIAFLAEQRKHGNPSGGDNTTSCYGQFVWYRKETPDLLIMHPISLTLPATFYQNLFLIATGQPKESTGEMVHRVHMQYKKKPQLFEKIFADQERLVRDLFMALQSQNEKEVIKIIKKGENNLEKIGVVSPKVTTCIKDIQKHGGSAKICGGGGRKENTGNLLVYMKNAKKLSHIAHVYNYSYERIQLGEEGLREEHI